MNYFDRFSHRGDALELDPRQTFLTSDFGSWVLKGEQCRYRIYAELGSLHVLNTPPVSFRCCDSSDPLATVKWIGSCSADDTYYPYQKAAIGMGGTDRIEFFNYDKMFEVVEKELQEARSSEHIRALLDLQEGLEYGEDIHSLLNQAGLYELYDQGMEYRPEVILAVSVVRRLYNLLNPRGVPLCDEPGHGFDCECFVGT